jgi:hypothetical protein
MLFSVVFIGNSSSLKVLNIDSHNIESAKVDMAELMELMGPLVKRCHIYSIDDDDDGNPGLTIVFKERMVSREEFNTAFKQYHGSVLNGDKWENLFPIKISELKTRFGTEICALL